MKISPPGRVPGDRFEEAWRKWTARPTRQSPSEGAARIVELIRGRQRRRQRVWAYAAAAVLLAGIAVAVHWTGLPVPSAPPPPAAAVGEAPSLGQGEVLMWIDKDTPLYMTFQPPEADQGKGGKL